MANKIEKAIKEETENIIRSLRQRFEKEGSTLTSGQEFLIRTGISYGIGIAGVALTKTPIDITFTEDDMK